MPKFLSISLYIFDTISEKLSLPKDTSDRKVVLQTQLLDTLTITTSTSKKMSENNETPCLSNEIDHWLRWSVVTTNGIVSNESNDEIDHWLRWS